MALETTILESNFIDLIRLHLSIRHEGRMGDRTHHSGMMMSVSWLEKLFFTSVFISNCYLQTNGTKLYFVDFFIKNDGLYHRKYLNLISMTC